MPINYESQKETLKRRQALAEQLIQKDYLSNTPQGAVTSPYAGLAQMLSSFTGNYQRSRADRDIRKLNEQQGLDKSADMTALLQAERNSQRLMPPVPIASPDSGENLNVPPAPAVTIPSATIPNSFDDYGNLFPRMKTEFGQGHLLQALNTNKQGKAAQRAEEVKFDRALEIQKIGAGNLATAAATKARIDADNAAIKTVNDQSAAALVAEALAEKARKERDDKLFAGFQAAGVAQSVAKQKAIDNREAAKQKAIDQRELQQFKNQSKTPPVGKPTGYNAELNRVNKNRMLQSIEGLITHPALKESVGRWLPNAYLPGTRRAAFVNLHDNVQSQVFLSGIKELMGMGALSDAEGQKVIAGNSKLSLSLSPEDYTKNAKELQGHVTNFYEALEKDYQKKVSGQPPAGQGRETSSDSRFRPLE